jgi:aldehyde:ferredoxin oxidoreductase
MSSDGLYGYAGKSLRVDLTACKITSEAISEDTLRKYIGGASLG